MLLTLKGTSRHAWRSTLQCPRDLHSNTCTQTCQLCLNGPSACCRYTYRSIDRPGGDSGLPLGSDLVICFSFGPSEGGTDSLETFKRQLHKIMPVSMPLAAATPQHRRIQHLLTRNQAEIKLIFGPSTNESKVEHASCGIEYIRVWVDVIAPRPKNAVGLIWQSGGCRVQSAEYILQTTKPPS